MSFLLIWPRLLYEIYKIKNIKELATIGNFFVDPDTVPFCENYGKLYFDAKHLEKWLNRGW